MRPLPRIVILILIAALALIPLHALAKGAPVKIVISGAGVSGEVVISDAARLEAFTAMNSNYNLVASAPDVDLSSGYRIDRYMVEDSLWDTHTYYADPEGGLGYLFCNGSKVLGSQNREKWFRATPEADQVMREVIADAAIPDVPDTALPSVPPMLLAGLAGLGAVLLGIGAIFEVRRRRGISAAV